MHYNFLLLISVFLLIFSELGFTADTFSVDSTTPIIAVPNNDQLYIPYSTGSEQSLSFDKIKFKTRKEIRSKVVEFINIEDNLLREMVTKDINDIDTKKTGIDLIITTIKTYISIGDLLKLKSSLNAEFVASEE